MATWGAQNKSQWDLRCIVSSKMTSKMVPKMAQNPIQPKTGPSNVFSVSFYDFLECPTLDPLAPAQPKQSDSFPVCSRQSYLSSCQFREHF